MPLFKPSLEKLIAKKDVQGLKSVLFEDKPWEDKTYARRQQAYAALVDIGTDEAIQAVIAAIKGTDYNIHYNVEILAKMDNRRVFDLILPTLGDWKPETRSLVIEVLAQAGGPRSVEPLIDRLKSDKDSSVRFKAAEALLKIGDPCWIEAFNDQLKSDKDDELRLCLAKALSEAVDPASVEAFISALRNGSRDLQELAATALQKIGTPEAEQAAAEWVEKVQKQSAELAASKKHADEKQIRENKQKYDQLRREHKAQARLEKQEEQRKRRERQRKVEEKVERSAEKEARKLGLDKAYPEIYANKQGKAQNEALQDRDSGVQTSANEAIAKTQSLSAPKGKCDLCGCPLDSHLKKYSAFEIQFAARKGLRPPAGYTHLATAFGLKDAGSDAWLNKVMLDISDWALCPDCAARVDQYL